MMARLVDNGAAGMTAPQLAARIESLGAQIGANANADSSSIFVAAPTATIGEAGACSARSCASRASRPRSWSASAAGRSISCASRCATRASSTSRSRCAPSMATRLMARPAGGSPASLAALTRDELVAYHRAWWRPDNATLIITGGMEPDAAFALAERMFGDWAAPADADAAAARQPGRERRRRRG